MFRELNTRLISNISYYRSCDYGLPKNLYKDINLDPTVDKFGQENGGRRSGQASLEKHRNMLSGDFRIHVLHKLLCVIGKHKRAVLYICMHTLIDGYGVDKLTV